MTHLTCAFDALEEPAWGNAWVPLGTVLTNNPLQKYLH